MTTEEVRRIPLYACRVHPLNRKRLGDLTELANDIAQNGIHTPLIGRMLSPEQAREIYDETNGGGIFQILAGARRYHAVQIVQSRSDVDTVAQGRVLPCIVREYDDEEALRFLMRENLHRVDVHPLDDAAYIEHAMLMGANVDMVAAELGKSESWVHQRLKLLDLHEDCKHLLEQGELSTAVAIEIARLSGEAQAQIWEEIKRHKRIDDGTTITAQLVRRWIDRYGHVLVLSAAAFSPKDDTLYPEAGACTACPKRTGAAPSLFGDLATKDSCTDVTCFEEKTARHIALKIAEFEAAGVEWAPLSAGHDRRDRRVSGAAERFENRTILFHGWWECRQKDKNAKRGIIVRGEMRRRGQTLWFNTMEDRYPAAYRSTSSPQQRAANARAKRDHQVKKYVRQQVFKAILEHKSEPTNAEMHEIALNIFGTLWHDSQLAIARTLGWDPKQQKDYSGWNLDRTARERVTKMNRAECLKFIRAISVGKYIERPTFSTDRDGLLVRAKLLKIDTAKLKREASAKFPLKKKRAKKKKAVKA